MPAYKIQTDFKFKKSEVVQDNGWLRSFYSDEIQSGKVSTKLKKKMKSIEGYVLNLILQHL